MNEVLLAPFSNSDTRDWPLEHWRALVGLLLPRLPADWAVRVLGAPSQRLRAHEVVRPHPGARVTNECGRLSWSQVTTRLGAAACVIGNNSGIGHLAGRLGAPTVCVFGGSHAREEWRPLGPNVVVVSRAIGCSPCLRDHQTGSLYRKACLYDIAPDVVADAALLAMTRGRRAPPPQAVTARDALPRPAA